MKAVQSVVSAVILVAASLNAMPVLAAPPSDASIRELLKVTHSDQLINQMMSGVEQSMNTSMQAALKGQPVTAEMKQQMQVTNSKISTVMKDAMAWSKIEPIMVNIYRQSYSQEEVNGMLTFYKSPIGQSVIQKQPVVAQKSMQLMQQHMLTVMPKIMQIAQESTLKLQQASTKKPVK